MAASSADAQSQSKAAVEPRTPSGPQVKAQAPAAPASSPSKPAAAKPAKGPKRVSMLGNREALVTWWLEGHRYGNPRLLNTRLVEKHLQHDTYNRLRADLAKKGVSLTVGLNFVDSQCYFVPKEILPKEETQPYGGATGVVSYHFGQVITRPGSFMILAAAETIVSHVLQQLVQLVKGQNVGPQRAGSKHILSTEHVASLMASTKDPIVHALSSFYDRWEKQVRSFDVQVAGGKVKRKWHPLPIAFPDVEDSIPDHIRVLIDSILEKRASTLRERGQKLAQKLILYRQGKQKEVPAVQEQKPKKAKAPTRSALQLAIDDLRKKDETTPKAVKPNEAGYNVTRTLSQGSIAKLLLPDVPDAQLYIGKIASKAKRYIDDLYNEVVITLCNVAIEGMATSGDLRLTPEIASMAINSYFFSIAGTENSSVRRDALDNARSTNTLYKSIIDGRKTRAKKEPSAVKIDPSLPGKEEAEAETEESDDAVAEEEDAVAEEEAAVEKN